MRRLYLALAGILLASSAIAVVPLGHEHNLNSMSDGGGGVPHALTAISDNEYAALFLAVPSPSTEDPTQFRGSGVYLTVFDADSSRMPIRVADSGPWLPDIRVTDDRSILMVSRRGLIQRVAVDTGEIVALVEADIAGSVHTFAASSDGRVALVTYDQGSSAEAIYRFDAVLAPVGEPVRYSSLVGGALRGSESTKLSLNNDGTLALAFGNSVEPEAGGPKRFWIQAYSWDGNVLLEPTEIPASSTENGFVSDVRALDDGSFVVSGQFCCDGPNDIAIAHWEVAADGALKSAALFDVSSNVFSDLLPDGSMLAMVTPDSESAIRTEHRHLVRLSGGEADDLGPIDIAFDFSDARQRIRSFSGSQAAVAWHYQLNQQFQARSQVLDMTRSETGDESVIIEDVAACIADVNSAIQLRWPEGSDLRLRSPEGTSLGTGGQFTTGLWAKYGFMLYLISPEGGALLDAKKIRLDGLQSAPAVERQPGPCPETGLALEPASFCGPRSSVSILLPADLIDTSLEVRANAADGPVIYRGSGKSEIPVADWVRHNTRLFITTSENGGLVDVLTARVDRSLCDG